ncbi:MAG: magnesium transporter CorA family protein [Gaiellales bacterium]
MAGVVWTDLLDPDREELERAAPRQLHPRALDLMLAPARHDDEPRPTFEAHIDYVFGVLLVPVLNRESHELRYQEIDIVLTHDSVMTVRKTPPECPPFDPSEIQAVAQNEGAGMIAYRIVDEVAEGFLDLVDLLDTHIDDLEDHVEEWPSERIRGRLSDLRHKMLHVRQTLSPTRDAVRRVVDNRIDTEGRELFSRDLELRFGDSYDKLLRASEGLDLARDLVASVRDYHQAKVANDQNEVMKRLTVIASVLLVPTFIVGLYGQNLQGVPEFGWSFGYWWSWGLIVLTTIGQIIFYRRKRWI